MKDSIRCGIDLNLFFIGKEHVLKLRPIFGNVIYVNATKVN
jgi:hypothetical protein